MAFINYVTSEVTVTIQGRSGGMDFVLSWHEDPAYADPDVWTENPQIIYEHIPLNSVFVDNGLRLTYLGVDGEVTDLSNRVERYGYVNTTKVGEYVLKYFCEYKSWSRIYEHNENDVNISYYSRVPVADFRWKKSRKIIVYEPNWLTTLTPQIHQALYPMINQTIQRYQELYWDLNYKTDNVRLGTKSSSVAVPKYRSDWSVPVGRLFRYEKDNNLWCVYGHTFSQNDKVEVDFTGKNNFIGNPVLSDLFVFSVHQENLWAVDHVYIAQDMSREENYYKIGSWVQFLDKIYVCHKDHTIVQDRYSKIKPKIIYPTDEEYWAVGCRVELARYDYDAESPVQRTAITDIIGDELDYVLEEKAIKSCNGYAIRHKDIVVEAQGFMYRYIYEPSLAALSLFISARPPFIMLYVGDMEILQPYYTEIVWSSDKLTDVKISWEDISPAADHQANLALIASDIEEAIHINPSMEYYDIPKKYVTGKNAYIMYKLECSENYPFIALEWNETNPDYKETSAIFEIGGTGIDGLFSRSERFAVNIRVPKIKIIEFSMPSIAEVNITYNDPEGSNKCEVPITWQVENASEVKFDLYKITRDGTGKETDRTNRTPYSSFHVLNAGGAIIHDVLGILDLSEYPDGEYAYVLTARREAYDLLETEESIITKTTKYEAIVKGGKGSGYYCAGFPVITIAEPGENEDFNEWVEEETSEPALSVEGKNYYIYTFTMPDHPLTLKADCTTKLLDVEVFYNVDDGDNVDAIDCEIGCVTYQTGETDVGSWLNLPVPQIPYYNPIDLKATPADDYLFVAWYDTDDKALSYQEILSIASLTSDLKVIAAFEKKKVKVTFYKEPMNMSTRWLRNWYPFAEFTIPKGDKIDMPETEPTRDGYVFRGWYGLQATDITTDADGSINYPSVTWENDYYQKYKECPWNFENTISEDTEIYAKWKPIIFNLTVKYYGKRAQNNVLNWITITNLPDDETPGQEVILGERLTIQWGFLIEKIFGYIGFSLREIETATSSLDQRAGYKFAGWYLCATEDSANSPQLQEDDPTINGIEFIENKTPVSIEITQDIIDKVKNDNKPDIYIAAKYIPNKHKVNFIFGLDWRNSGEDKVIITIEKDYDSFLTYKDLPSLDVTGRKYYKLEWYTPQAINVALPTEGLAVSQIDKPLISPVPSYLITQDMNVYAKYTLLTPIITREVNPANSGNTISLRIASWALIDLSASPEQETNAIGSWDAGTQYVLNDVVKASDNKYYKSRIHNNMGNNPLVPTATSTSSVKVSVACGSIAEFTAIPSTALSSNQPWGFKEWTIQWEQWANTGVKAKSTHYGKIFRLAEVLTDYKIDALFEQDYYCVVVHNGVLDDCGCSERGYPLHIINYYKALMSSKSADPVDNADKWEKYDITDSPVWNATDTYSINAIVKSNNGDYYRSLVAANKANSPQAMSSMWELVSVWLTATNYTSNQVVRKPSGTVVYVTALDLIGHTFREWVVNEPEALTLLYDEPPEPIGGDEKIPIDFTKTHFIIPTHDVEIEAQYDIIQYILTVGLYTGNSGKGIVIVEINEDSPINPDTNGMDTGEAGETATENVIPTFTHTKGVLHDYGTKFKITAIPNEGYEFVEWCDVTNRPYEEWVTDEPIHYFELTENMTLAAKFVEIIPDSGEV